MLGWSQQKLATETDIARSTLALIEKGHEDANNATRAKVQKKLEEAGIEFLPSEEKRGEGIRLNLAVSHGQALTGAADDRHGEPR